MLSKEFLILVILSFVIASPIAWWLMSKWLGSFAFRITLQWWSFALVGAIAVVIAIATVSFQSVKAAMANPVNSLRAE